MTTSFHFAREQICSALDHSPIATAILDGRGLRFRWCNRAFADAFAEARGEGIAGIPAAWLFGHETAAVEGMMRRAAGERLAARLPEVAHEREGGLRTWWHVTLAPLEGEPEMPADVLLQMTDVTTSVLARQQSEGLAEQLRVANERWELAVRGTEDGIWDWDIAGEALYWSPRAKEMLGYRDGELVVSREMVRELIHPEDRAGAWENTRQQLAGTGEHYRGEYRLRHRDGTYRWVLARGLILRDAQGAARRIVGSHVDLTEQRRAQDALRQSREQLLGIINNSPATIFVKDLEGRYLLVNEPFKRAAQRDDVTGLRDADLFDAETAERVHARDAEVVRSGRAQTLEEVIVYQGRTFTFLATKFPLLTPNGEPYAVCGIATEITAIKEAEARLRQSEEYHRQFLENLPQMAWTCRADGYCDYLSPQWAAYTGGQTGEFYGTGWQRAIHPDDRAQAARAWEEAVSGDKPYDVEYRLRAADGSYRWFHARGTRFRDAQGKVLRWFGTTTDVHDQRAAMEKLRESERRLQVALDAGRMGTWEWFIKEGRVAWSETLERLHGMEPGSFPGTVDAVMADMHPDDRPMLAAAMERVLREKSEHHVSYRYFNKAGEERWVEAHGTLICDASGQPQRMVGVCTDITERRHAEESLRHANNAKDRFLAVLSHELRTPLTPVVMTLAALDLDEHVPASIKQDLSLIRRNIELETQLIDDLLDVTRIANGKLRLTPRVVRVHELLSHACSICGAEARAKGITLSITMQAVADETQADPARLEQVFWNLVKNAVKFTHEGGRVEVSTTTEADGGLHVRVRDSGIGIMPQVMERLFIAFEQGEQTVTRTFGGLGLGLAISRAIVEMHGGRIWAESAGKGQGATFHVVLPLEAQGAPAGGSGTAPERGEGGGRGAVPLRVLVVDDHADTLKVMERLLTAMGMEIKTATSVKGALALAASVDLDLVISDIGLPDGTGLDLAAELRRARPGLPAIALSGFGMDSDQRRSLEAGFRAHLTKPVALERLQEAIAVATASGDERGGGEGR